MNNVKQLRLSAGMQQKELALIVGVAAATVSEWEHGKKNPSGERLKKLSQIFGVSIGTVLGIEEGFIPIRKGSVPIVGEIACGVPITAEENIDGYADLPDGVHADFALRCKGDSMTPTFENGDLVLIRQQPEVQNGQIAAVNVNGETTLKHVYYQENGLLLVADNPQFSPIFIARDSIEDFIIHGLAIGYTRMFQ